MPDDRLRTASEELRQASAATDDAEAQRRLYDLSDTFARLATGDNDPDHGRLARHLNTLNELRDGADEDVTTHLDAAEEAITAYRETVDGV